MQDHIIANNLNNQIEYLCIKEDTIENKWIFLHLRRESDRKKISNNGRRYVIFITTNCE